MSRLAAYARAQKETASPERLMVLLFEAAQRHMKTAAAALESQDAAIATNSLTRASDIVLNLMSTLDSRHSPALSDTLTRLYEFVALRLSGAMTSRDAGAVREAERVFAPLVSAFSEAVAGLPSGGAGQSTP